MDLSLFPHLSHLPPYSPNHPLHTLSPSITMQFLKYLALLPLAFSAVSAVPVESQEGVLVARQQLPTCDITPIRRFSNNRGLSASVEVSVFASTYNDLCRTTWSVVEASVSLNVAQLDVMAQARLYLQDLINLSIALEAFVS